MNILLTEYILRTIYSVEIDGSAELSHRVFLHDIFLILIVDLKYGIESRD